MIPTKKLTDTQQAGQLLAHGKLVAFPTETVFGLGADAGNSQAVGRIFAAKGRPSDNPLIIHLAAASDWPQAASKLTPIAQALLDAFAPGPLTVILPKAPSISGACTAGMDSVAIRVPSSPYAREILRAARIPIAAPSANRSGRPSCTTWQSVLEDLDGRIDALFCRNAESIGLESTVVDCRFHEPRILRPGAITETQIQNACASHVKQAEGGLPAGSPARCTDVGASMVSPGVRHAHYQPNARVRLFQNVQELDEALRSGDGHLACCVMPSALPKLRDTNAAALANRLAGLPSLTFFRSFESLDEYAAGFYEFLRESDRRGAEQILVQLVDQAGIGEALRDRQLRSAGKQEA